MPLTIPALDDRTFDDLVNELVARIPAHTPEWSQPLPGDPGRTVIELFAWLADTLLYRANLIPERQRLVFLKLLGIPQRPAIAARGLVSVQPNAACIEAVSLNAGAAVTGAARFETRAGITVMPVTGEAYVKRALTGEEKAKIDKLLDSLRKAYKLPADPDPYVTAPVFADAAGFDLVKAKDGCLWIALLAPAAKDVDAAREALGDAHDGRQPVLNAGIVPAIQLPEWNWQPGAAARIPHVWELSTGRLVNGAPEYLPLEVIEDTTLGLTRAGIERLVLPAAARLGALANDPRKDLQAGVGDRPPRLDDKGRADRLVTWLRLRPEGKLESLALAWAGINAVEIDQRATIRNRVVGVSNGSADQQCQLPGTSIEAASLEVSVEEPGRGFVEWRAIDDLATASRDDSVFQLDAEAGTIRFGDGVRGRVPEPEQRISVDFMRAGGGAAGNLAPGSLKAVEAEGRQFKVLQPLATEGGADAETMAEAVKRIPSVLRHGERAVTADDYKRLAVETPGVRVGRVEVLPGFKPQPKDFGYPGVVSVMVLPHREGFDFPNPRADRPFLEAVDSWLRPRRPLAAELYTIGCEYVPVAVSVAVTLLDGSERNASLQQVRDAVRQYLSPLGPGWPLKKTVREAEIETIVARVAPVDTVPQCLLFRQDGSQWVHAPQVTLSGWQLPELQTVLATVGTSAQTNIDATEPTARAGTAIAVPVVPDPPEVC